MEGLEVGCKSCHGVKLLTCWAWATDLIPTVSLVVRSDNKAGQRGGADVVKSSEQLVLQTEMLIHSLLRPTVQP